MLVRHQEDLMVGANAAAKIGGAAQVAYTLYDRFVGAAYSAEDIQKLKILKQIYKDYLDAEPPVQWELDDKSCPTHHIQSQHWARYCSELGKKNKKTSVYYHQSKIIAKVASSYLEARTRRSDGGNGSPGDLLEQYIGEWVSFALNELPQLSGDDDSIAKLRQRIEYLDQIDSNVSVFKYGKVNRTVTKFDVFDDIGEQLKICVDIALIEKSRICARDLLDKCRNSMSALLSDCADVIFYARATSVDAYAFDLSRYVESNRGRERAVDLAYKAAKETHTGSILYEVIALAGAESFGLEKQPTTVVEPRYYSPENYQLREVDWTSAKMDLFPWIGDKLKQKEMKKIQELGQSMLFIAQIKALIETAYDLTGVVGDLWAYGDKNGKQSLKALLFLMDKELVCLTQRFNLFYQENKMGRKIYGREKKENALQGSNPNFSEVDRASKKINERLRLMKANIKDIQQQMNDFPTDAVQKINQKKSYFYTSLNRYFSIYCPDDAREFPFTDMTSMTTDESTRTNANGQMVPGMPVRSPLQHHGMDEEKAPRNEQKEVAPLLDEQPAVDRYNLAFHFPLKNDDLNEKYIYWDNVKFKDCAYQYPDQEKVEERQQNWKLGGKYEDWMKGYFTRHKDLYSEYQALATDLQYKLSHSLSVPEIDEANLQLQARLSLLKMLLENERPKWRFKLGWWPIKTKGWPFNRDANRFSELLLGELDNMSIRVEAKVAVTKLHLAEVEENPEDEPQLDLAVDHQDKLLPVMKQPEGAAAALSPKGVSHTRILSSLSSSASGPESDLSETKGESVSNSAPEMRQRHSTSRSVSGVTSLPKRFLKFYYPLVDKLNAFVNDQSTQLEVFSDQAKARQNLELCLDFRDNAETEDNMEIVFQSLLNMLSINTSALSAISELQTTSQLMLLKCFFDAILAQPESQDRQKKIQLFYTECQKQLPRGSRVQYGLGASGVKASRKEEAIGIDHSTKENPLSMSHR
ncbi:MAG: hypothetical protein P4M14_10375 [Gammaproteobacteria bacterium]|nr:hypothetical protein [Gammaproteobacteria bacterium]